MEQMRLTEPAPRKAIPCLRAGDVMWEDYTVSVRARAMIEAHFSGILFRYQTSMMHYGFFLVPGGVELHRVDKLERTVLAHADACWNPDEYCELSVSVDGDVIRCSLDGKVL